MTATDRTWLAVVVAGLLAGLTLRPLTTDDGFLYAGAFLMVLTALVAVAGDRLRLSKALVAVVQLLVMGVALVAFAVAPGDPNLSWWRRLGPLVASGIDHMRVSAAPMPPDDGVRVILAATLAGLALIAGILADQLERPALSLAPLATMYAIPAIALRTQLSWVPFVAVGLGYLAILFADGLNADRSWTRNIASDRGATEGARHSGGIWRLAALVAVPAVIASIVVGMVLPTLTTTFFDSLRPSGSGPVEMTDPQLDLRRNLQQPENRPVLSYTTNRETGPYLRLTALPAITPDGWVQNRVTLRQGALGPVPGLTSPPSQSRVTNIQIRDFRSMYLPLPYAPRAQDAKGEWSYDPDSLMVIATGQDRQGATANLSYTAQSWDIEPDGAGLSNARAGTPPDSITAEVPAEVPQSIVQLTNSLTKDAQTPALKAAAIQAYLRTFSYSVQGASGATNYKAIETFLLQTRTGYCVQFAGSMALMARIAGIPSRVAIGFLPGAKQGDTWVVNSHDMHAWPELYFEGYGWVRFEPTPSVAVPPPWTVLAPNQPIPSQSSVPEPSVTASAEATPSSTPTAAPIDSGSASTGLPLGTIARLLGIAALAVAVLLLPWLFRRRLRAGRIAAQADDDHVNVAGAWAEIRDTWVDIGRVWPSGTARQIAGQVAAVIGDGEPRESLRRIVIAVERSRYAAVLGDLGPLGNDVTGVVAALEGSVGWDRRLLARFRPASLWAGLTRWAESMTTARRARPDKPIPSAEATPAGDDSPYRRP